MGNGPSEPERLTPPWEGLPPAAQQLTERATTFLSPVDPLPVGFDFRMEDNVHILQCAYQQDKNLQYWVPKLVPSKVKEDVFWFNYFSHLEVIRRHHEQSVGCSDDVKLDLGTCGAAKDETTTQPDANGDSGACEPSAGAMEPQPSPSQGLQRPSNNVQPAPPQQAQQPQQLQQPPPTQPQQEPQHAQQSDSPSGVSSCAFTDDALSEGVKQLLLQHIDSSGACQLTYREVRSAMEEKFKKDLSAYKKQLRSLVQQHMQLVTATPASPSVAKHKQPSGNGHTNDPSAVQQQFEYAAQFIVNHQQSDNSTIDDTTRLQLCTFLCCRVVAFEHSH